MKKTFLILISFIGAYNIFAISLPIDSSYKYLIATRESKSVKFEVEKGVKVWDNKKVTRGIIDSITADSIYLVSFNKRNSQTIAIAIDNVEAIQPLNISKLRRHHIGLIASGSLGIIASVALFIFGNSAGAAGISFILIPAVIGALCFYAFIGFGISYLVQSIRQSANKCEKRKEFTFKAER